MAAEKSIKVYGLSEYYVDREKGSGLEDTTILLGYANMNEEKIREAVRLLGVAWNEDNAGTGRKDK